MEKDNRISSGPLNVLVIDVGGTNVKVLATGNEHRERSLLVRP
jgi:hexokinase